MDELIALFSELPAGDVPEWVHLVPAGEFRGADGRGPYRLHDAAKVVAASKELGKLPIDENHAIDRLGPAGHASPARGWIVDLQVRADGIWGKVEWTGVGTQLVSDKAYRGLSPAIAHERGTGRIVRIERASLTNTPNLPITTLHDRETSMDLEKLRKALGLANDAGEDAIVAAVEAQATSVAQHSAELAKVAKAAGLSESEQHGADAIVTALQSRQAEEPKEVKELRGTVISLQTELNTLKADTTRKAAEAVVDAAIEDGKPITALRDHYIERHMKDPEGVAKELATMISLHSGGIRREVAIEGGKTQLTETELALCSQLGLTADEFVKSREAN